MVLLTVRMCQLTDTAELSPTSSLKCQAYTDFEENDPFLSKADGDIEVNIMIFFNQFHNIVDQLCPSSTKFKSKSCTVF